MAELNLFTQKLNQSKPQGFNIVHVEEVPANAECLRQDYSHQDNVSPQYLQVLREGVVNGFVNFIVNSVIPQMNDNTLYLKTSLETHHHLGTVSSSFTVTLLE
jgi:hypothetical protein